MNELLINELGKEEISDTHRKLLNDCKALVKLSRDKMSESYNRWDIADQTYRAEREKDAEDKAAENRKEPVKMVVPITKSQINTFVAFSIAMLTQNERFYELEEFTTASHDAARAGEAILQRDLEYNQFLVRLWQFFTDLAKFGVGVMKCQWVEETQKVREMVPTGGINVFGLQLTTPTMTEMISDVVKFQGNKITNISPYRFFPDTRLPLTRFQEGEFIASEDEYSKTSLLKMEKDGLVVGIKHIKKMTQKDVDTRGASRLCDTDITTSINTKGDGQSQGVILVTEVQREIVPKEYLINDKPIGEEDYPVKYVFWIANDQRIIKCEPMNYLHDEFTYVVAQINPDQHQIVNDGLANDIQQLQDILTWFINSRITSVRKNIDNRLIVDPSAIEMGDVTNRKPVIRLKADGARGGIDKAIKQLDVSDVTTNHLGDAKYLHELIQVTTGISDNALGQFHTGRRSATEAKNVNSGSFQRLKTSVMLAYTLALKPLGRQMLSNLRDGLDAEAFVKIMKDDAEASQEFLAVDKNSLVGDYDFEIMDGTLPSERSYMAQAIENVLLALMKAPDAAIALQMDPRALLLESMTLRGIKNPKRFTLSVDQMMLAQQQQQMQNGQPGVISGGASGEGAPPPSVEADAALSSLGS
jgi:hypothetical protein